MDEPRPVTNRAVPGLSGRRPARRGIALLLVLIIVSIGAAITMRFLQAAADGCLLSQNLAYSRQAESLAESGIAEACYWLGHPELTGGTAWAGAAGRRLGSSLHYYDVTVTPKPAAPQTYTVISEGHLTGGAGDGCVRTVRAEFQMYEGFAEAVASPHDVFVPASVTIYGNVFAFGGLDVHGRVDGSVWVGGAFTNSGTITGSTNLGAAARDIGSYPVTMPVIYTHDSVPYAAATMLLDTAEDQTLSPNLANPAGVYGRDGNLRLAGVTTVDGTLIVSGNLTLAAGGSTTITSKSNYPALVVQGNLLLEGDALAATISGAVIVHGRIQATGSMPTTRVGIHGPLVFPNPGGGFDAAFAEDPTVVIRYDPARADVSGLYPAQPRTAAGAKMACYRAEEM